MANLELAALAYLRHVLEQMRISPSALAKKAGLSSTTLTRALNDPDHKFTLTTSTIQKIADASGINPAPFLKAGNVAELSAAPIFRDDVYNKAQYGRSFGPPNFTIIVGEIAVGKWIEPGVVPVGKYGTVPLIHSHVSPSECFACKVADQSVNSFARPDDLLFCMRFERRKPILRSLVVVEQRDTKNFRIELTARMLVRQAEGWTLEFANDQKTSAEVLHLNSLSDDPQIKIIGLVDWIMRAAPAVEGADRLDL